jgi:AcrR family transcriptional regulator
MSATRSNRRQKQAAATRQDILDAARRLFATKGYGTTSMAAIAREAETAVQTIYDSIGAKHAIILALVGVIEEEAGVDEFRQRISQARESREAIALFVGLTRQFTERSGDVFVAMMTAAPSEPDVAAAWDEANRNHRQGARYVVDLLDRLGALKPGISVEQAGDALAMLTWGVTWQQLTGVYGWSLDECERWLNESIGTLLLGAPS